MLDCFLAGSCTCNDSNDSNALAYVSNFVKKTQVLQSI